MSSNTKLIEVIFKLSRLMREHISFAKNDNFFSMLQLQTLSFIKRNKDTSMTGIAHQFNIELSSATSLVDKLSEMNLVKRIEDKADRRLVKLALTKKGELMLDVSMRKKITRIKRALSYLSEREKENLFKIVQKLVNKIGKNYEK